MFKQCAGTVLLISAPAQEEWSGCRATPGSAFHQNIGSPDNVAVCGCIFPDVPVEQPLGLLALTDGEIWFDHLGVSAAIDAAIRSGRIAPVAVLALIISMRVNAS